MTTVAFAVVIALTQCKQTTARIWDSDRNFFTEDFLFQLCDFGIVHV
jgi:hypothetical protein